MQVNQDTSINGVLSALRVDGALKPIWVGRASTVILPSGNKYSNPNNFNLLVFECLAQEDLGVPYYETIVFDRQYQSAVSDTLRFGNRDINIEKGTENTYYIGSNPNSNITTAECVAVYGIGGIANED